ncbi:MAG: alpha/beta hydrolase [Clostridia bacterium]|nr:alpha/beta hydrolase [Clostridia bacterium]
MKSKRIFSLLLFVGLLLSIVACAGTGNDPMTTTASSSTEQTTIAVTTPEPTYETPVVPDPEDLPYAEVPQSIRVNRESHDPLYLWSDTEHVPYWDSSLPETDIPCIRPYLIEGDGLPCVIVCPGGGYKYRSEEAEGSIIASYANTEWGMQAFVLTYRVAPADYRSTLSDVLRAVRYVRFYAKDLGVDPNRIAVMGFSAGGHLACMSAQHFDSGKEGDAIDHVSSRPDAAILCYPVITLSGSWKHEGSATRFLGEAASDEALAKFFSGEEEVRPDMPPVFLFHSKADKTVPYRNSEELAKAMEAAGLSCTFQLYQTGGHGCSLALTSSYEVKNWTTDCKSWLLEIGFIQS